jgi:hypothetical protein
VGKNGNMELYSVSDFSLRFVALNFPHQGELLVDNMSTRASTQAEPAIHLDKLSTLTEVLMVRLGM